MNSHDNSSFCDAFSALDVLIETVQETIPLVQEFLSPRLILIKTLLHVASIRLHNPLILVNEISRAKSLAAAQSVVRILDSGSIQQFRFVDPLMGVSDVYLTSVSVCARLTLFF